jgi:hypothetical protein
VLSCLFRNIDVVVAKIVFFGKLFSQWFHYATICFFGCSPFTRSEIAQELSRLVVDEHPFSKLNLHNFSDTAGKICPSASMHRVAFPAVNAQDRTTPSRRF